MNAEPEGAHAGNVEYLPSAGAQNMVQLYKTLEATSRKLSTVSIATLWTGYDGSTKVQSRFTRSLNYEETGSAGFVFLTAEMAERGSDTK